MINTSSKPIFMYSSFFLQMVQCQVPSWHKCVAGGLDSQSLSDNILFPPKVCTYSKILDVHQFGINTNSPVCKIYLFLHTELCYGEKPNDDHENDQPTATPFWAYALTSMLQRILVMSVPKPSFACKSEIMQTMQTMHCLPKVTIAIIQSCTHFDAII